MYADTPPHGAAGRSRWEALLVNDPGSLLEFLAYLGSIVFFALLIRELGRPDGAASLADLLALSREPRPRHIAEDEPGAWKLDRLHPRRQRAGAADRSPAPLAGGARRAVLPERPLTACEGS
jgi:hypothetical protein